MKKIFYSIMALALLTACSNDDMLPEVPNEGLIELASVGIGAQTRGSVDDEGEFSFSDGDKVLMTVEVNENSFSNSFTYNGGKWTQDAPVGDYRSIYVQDSPTVNSIVSYGGKAEGGVYTDQSSMESYAMASSLAADPMRYLGDITIDENVVTARLDHDNSDLALKVYDGYDEKNTLVENTPVLKVIVDEDGSGADSKLLNFTAWNAGKDFDANGYYTLFRVQLPAGCSILEAELSNVNETAGGLKTDIFFRASDCQPSNEIDLEAGRRYSASYTYDMLKTVATVNVSISPFEGGDLDHDIIASRDWSFDETTKTYTVFTAEGLQIVNQDIAKNIATKGAYNITLAADITLPDPVAPETSNWIPLGHQVNDVENYIFEEYPYSGVFDGAGHTISNLRINNDDTDNRCVGLIGLIGDGGAVKNLTLDNPEITSTGSCVGGLVGYSDRSTESHLITNCHIKGGSIKSAFEVGGIAGEYLGDMLACTVNGTIIEGHSKVGGLIGFQYHGRIIACGVDGVNLRCSDNLFGGIAGFWGATGLSQSPGYMYSCYAKDCTKGTDSQALEGTANLLGAFGVQEGYSLTAKNCAYRAKNGSITYGLGGTDGPTNGDLLSSELFTETGTADSDWPTASRDLNVGIDEWNGFDPTLPCNWEWNTSATEEGKLKVKQ